MHPSSGKPIEGRRHARCRTIEDMGRIPATPYDDPSRDMCKEKSHREKEERPRGRSMPTRKSGKGREPKKTPNLDLMAYRATVPNIRPAVWNVLSLLSRSPFRTQVALLPIVRPATPLR